MYDADNLDPVRHGTIQNQVIAHLKIAKFRGNIRPQPAPSTDYLQAPGSAAQYRQAHDRGGSGVILSDINPYLNQVSLGLRGSLITGIKTNVSNAALCLGTKAVAGLLL